MTSGLPVAWKLGDRVRVNPAKSVGWVAGTVTAVDEPGLGRGVRVDFDEPVLGVTNCYATHGELRPEEMEAMTGDLVTNEGEGVAALDADPYLPCSCREDGVDHEHNSHCMHVESCCPFVRWLVQRAEEAEEDADRLAAVVRNVVEHVRCLNDEREALRLHDKEVASRG